MFEILLPLNYVSNLNQEEFSSLTTQNAVSDLYSAYSKDYDNTYIYLSQVFILMYRVQIDNKNEVSFLIF